LVTSIPIEQDNYVLRQRFASAAAMRHALHLGHESWICSATRFPARIRPVRQAPEWSAEHSFLQRNCFVLA
jgi:hypothetical protein